MQYLSQEWLSEADNAVRSAAASAPNHHLVIDQVVTDAASYQIRINGEESTIVPLEAGASSDAHARFTQSLATAVAIAQGVTDAHQAFLLGHIRFEGDAAVLIERQEAFAWLEGVLAPVLAATAFPPME